MEPTSEQELKQLLDEGKISEEEYHELKRAMIEKDKSQSVGKERGENKPKLVHRLGMIALILVLSGIVLPVIGYFLLEPTTYKTDSGSAFEGTYVEGLSFLFLGMQLAGFVMGVISWKDSLGKAAAIISGILLLLSVLFIA